MGLPGLVGQYQPQIVSQAAKYMYMMGWVLTFVTAAVIYTIGVTFVKPQLFPTGREDTPSEYEWLANEGREGFYDGEAEHGEVLYSPSSPVLVADGVTRVEKGDKSSESA